MNIAAKISRGTAAVAVLGGTLTVLSAALLTLTVSFVRPAAPTRPDLPWWVLAVLFAIAQTHVLNIQAEREARSVSLTEIPLVLGLMYASPPAFLLARVVGGVAAQVLARRQYRHPVKLAFNSAVVGAEAAVGLAVFGFLAHGVPVTSPRAWLAAVAAATAANAVSGLAVAALIGLIENTVRFGQLIGVVRASAPQAAAMATLGLVSALTYHLSRWTVLPLTAAVGILFIAYRGYATLRERHSSLERLYRFSRVVTADPDTDRVLVNLLEQVCDMLHADAARITFLAPDTGRPDSEAYLRRTERLQRRLPDNLTSQASWLFDMVCREPHGLLLERGSKAPAYRHWLERNGLREAMLVPLHGDGQVVAVLTVIDRLGETRGFDAADLRLLETVANHASVALRNGQLVDRLRHDSLHDALTGIPNRSHLHHEIDRLLGELAAGAAPFALAMLDLDTFKDVNDTLGHHQGDVLLCEVATRLAAAVAGRGQVARFGGDEFAILLPDCGEVGAVVRFCRGILDVVMEPIALDGTTVDVGASIGIARAPEHATSRPDLIKRADQAMFVAKRAGREVVSFDPAYDTSSPSRLALVAALRQAISDAALEVYVQPKASLSTGQTGSVEALVRWTDPQRGPVQPDEFVPLAERSGLIRPLTDLVLNAALAECAGWQDRAPDVGIAVNLSARSLRDNDLDRQIGRLLRRYGLPARLLTLEITETSVMADPASTLGLLHRLRHLGVRLSIDDFGTGYSSLSYLRRLPVHEVKIDRSFVQRMHEQSDDAAIVGSIVQLARTLELEVVAEGVEQPATWQLLKRMSCAQAQGYLISRPMPAADFPDWWQATHRSQTPRLSIVSSAPAM